MEFPRNQESLAELGKWLVREFCDLNDLTTPEMDVIPLDHWSVGACAYYRHNTIRLCLPCCGRPCTEAQSRNWSWPGSVTDREPYGVFAHELGHHVDMLSGTQRGAYWSDYSSWMLKTSGEKPLTSYAATNPAEWFAEAFRLFATNPELLSLVRPRTHALITQKWKPAYSGWGWLHALGSNVPARVVKAQRNKMVVQPGAIHKSLF